MSKNKYKLPFAQEFYIEFGGIKKEDSHSWDIPLQRYAYDFEIRDAQNKPYHDDYLQIANYYSYKQKIYAPLDGYVVDICDEYEDTQIRENRPIICDCRDVKGNYILIKHKHNEYSLIAHILKNSFQVKIGDMVKTGDYIAQVGNSGNSNGPHIHYQVQDGFDFEKAKGIPISFQNIIIKRNKKRVFRNYVKNGEFVQNKNK